MSYNGWTNKETWLVNLWLGDYFAELQEEGETISPELIQENVEEWLSYAQGNDPESGFLVDLLNCALGEINYHELAKHYSAD